MTWARVDLPWARVILNYPWHRKCLSGQACSLLAFHVLLPLALSYSLLTQLPISSWAFEFLWHSCGADQWLKQGIRSILKECNVVNKNCLRNCTNGVIEHQILCCDFFFHCDILKGSTYPKTLIWIRQTRRSKWSRKRENHKTNLQIFQEQSIKYMRKYIDWIKSLFDWFMEDTFTLVFYLTMLLLSLQC